MKVLIAGAGLAGLHAAWRLHARGHDVAVFEARSATGGRTWSARLPNGTVVERGGEFIHAGQHAIRALCAQLGLPVIPHGIEFERRSAAHGVSPTVARVQQTMAALREHVGSQPVARDPSVAAAFEAVLGPTFEQDAVYRRVVTSLAAAPENASARALVAKWPDPPTGYVGHWRRVLGGNQGICRQIAAELGAAVTCDKPVRGISESIAGVEFDFVDGDRVVGDAAVVALPLLALRELSIDPGLPRSAHEALDGLLAGAASKLSVGVAEGADSRGVQSPTGMWWAWNSMAAAGDRSEAAVTAFAGGPATVGRLQAASDDGTGWRAELAELRPDLTLDGAHLVTHWQDVEWVHFAYSSPTVGWVPAHASAFDAAFGRIVLAGEHTAGPLMGTMNGAVHSGARAARLVESLGDRR